MRILLTSPTYPPINSGLGNAVSQQAEILSSAGHEVVVATGGSQRATRNDTVNHVRIEEFAVTGADSLLQPIRGDVVAYVEFLQRSEYDVVLVNAWQNWATDLVLKHIKQIRGRKFLYSHCISTNAFFAHQPFRSLLRYLAWRPYWWGVKRHMQALDGIIFLAERGMDSRFDDRVIARECSVTAHVIPNSISKQALIVLQLPAKRMVDRDQLIAVGSYYWQKGFDFILRAYAASRAKNCIPLKFFGQERSVFTEKLRRLAVSLGIEYGFVVFNEGISGVELLQEYGRARLLLLGSHSECQPLVILDANASGTPFVARSTGCIDQMPGGASVKTVVAMASEIDAMISDPVLWQQVSNAGRVAASGLYHPDRVGRLLLNTIEASFNADRGKAHEKRTYD